MKNSLSFPGFFGMGVLVFLTVFPLRFVFAQILMSSGTNYSQNFDTLATSGSSNGWTNNETLVGWYAAKGAADASTYAAGSGTSATGSIYSFGVSGINPVTDRALGTLASSGNAYAIGVRFVNDTGFLITNICISFTAEQWRNANGANAETNVLAFSYRVAEEPATSADAADVLTWIPFGALDFSSPVVNVGGSGTSLDGNAPENRQTFTNVILTGVSVLPDEEIFLRWLDTDNSSSDAGLAIDDLSISWETNAFVSPAVPTNGSVTLMTYNVKGNGVTDWSTNTTQAQAIGREIMYLNPDVITFNEIPYTNTWQLANWVAAFMPGFYLATNSGTDGYIRSVIASRFPIARSKSWLSHADLNPFGYTNSNFTRDLFEAEINVPNWPQHLHVFTTHLKSSSSGYADAAAKRAAEAAAITNFLATNILAVYPPQPFTLSGDMNESDTNTTAVQELISAPTTLRLTNPQNPYTSSINTYSIQGSLTERIDYVFPCTLLFSNIISSQVFRTDKLPVPLPSDLYANDSKTASDHLPVLMTFANPFARPFSVTAFSHSNQTVNLQWESVPGGIYRVEASTDLVNWTSVVTNLLTPNYLGALSTNTSEQMQFFRVRTK